MSDYRGSSGESPIADEASVGGEAAYQRSGDGRADGGGRNDGVCDGGDAAGDATGVHWSSLNSHSAGGGESSEEAGSSLDAKDLTEVRV